MRPGIGNTFLEDDFSDTSLWDIASSDDASAIMEDNHLTLAAQSGVYMVSLRRDLILSDHYAEITARRFAVEPADLDERRVPDEVEERAHHARVIEARVPVELHAAGARA